MDISRCIYPQHAAETGRYSDKIKTLKLELKRAFCNRYFLIALLIGSAIALWQIIECVIPMIKWLDSVGLASGKSGAIPHSVFNKWLGVNFVSSQRFLYYLLLPLLAVLPHAGSYFGDIKSGYIKNIYMRTKRSNYIVSKYIAVFLSGAAVVAIPLLLNLGLTAACLPSLAPENTAGTFSIWPFTMWGELEILHPYIYTFLYILIDAVYAGLLATLALVFSFYLDNRFVVLFTPFLLYIFAYAVTDRVLGVPRLAPLNYLQPVQQYYAIPLVVFGVMALLLVAPLALFCIKGAREDTF